MHYHITSRHDPFGNLTQTTALGITTQMGYDIRGHKISMTDPDMGHWTYVVNPLGQLVKQTDAKSQLVTMQYDLLGRMTSRSEPDLISTWNWDTDDGTAAGSPCGPSKGKLCGVSSDNGVSRTISYDSYGRPSIGFTNIDAAYQSVTTYDAYGRVDTASTINQQGKGATIKRSYNAWGYLSQLTRTSDNNVLWTAQGQDAYGHLTQALLGNGITENHYYGGKTGRMASLFDLGPSGIVLRQSYTYDPVGNLKTRTDNVTGIQYGYTYDELDRLVSYQNGTSSPVSYSYDALGNLRTKGTNILQYGADCPGFTGGPHAVCLTAFQGAYSYDADGNLATGAGRTISYTSYNQVYQITDADGTTSFIHDADHQRVQQTRPDGSYDIYVNPLPGLGLPLEKAYTPAAGSNPAATDYKTALITADGQIGQSVAHVSNGTTTRLARYWHTDYQGSLMTITDDNAALIAQYSYTPWGARTVIADSTATRRGYTAHEHLDDGLIHMNGRIYDPVIGRFLQADPYVQAPDDGQSYNRYSYVLNNPLRYTDPTGFSAWTDFRDDILKPVAVIAAAWVIGPMVFNAVLPSAVGATGMGMQASLWAGTAMAGAASGAVVGGIAGGIYNGPQGIAQGAKYGAIGGAITGPVAGMYGGINGQGGSPWGWDRVAAQSVSGGLSAAAQGGSFTDGFRSSGIGSAFRYMYNSVVNYDVDPKPGGDAVVKADPLAMPVEGANNIGTAEPKVNPDAMWAEGGVVSRIANHVPSINAIAGMHDVFQVRLQEWDGAWARNVFNVPGMPVAAAMTWMGLRDTDHLSYDTIQRIDRLGR